MAAGDEIRELQCDLGARAPDTAQGTLASPRRSKHFAANPWSRHVQKTRDFRTLAMERHSSVSIAVENSASPRNLLYAAGPIPKREAIQQ